MTNVLILGASGSVARVATELFLKETDAWLTLYVRNANSLKNVEGSRTRVVVGDVLDTATLTRAMAGQDVVYAKSRRGARTDGAKRRTGDERKRRSTSDLDQLDGDL